MAHFEELNSPKRQNIPGAKKLNFWSSAAQKDKVAYFEELNSPKRKNSQGAKKLNFLSSTAQKAA